MRESGILLPVSSLPSGYGIGCFSREAYEFADSLSEAGQSYWQILPLGPVGYGDSPYQSFSTFAGNPYYISPQALVERGWLTMEDCQDAGLASDPRHVDYVKQYNCRFTLLKKAWKNSRIEADPEFQKFCDEKQDWLDDFTLFMALKDEHGGRPWYVWDDPLRLRDPEALKQARERLKEETGFFKFLQFEFYREWADLKNYANGKGIRIIGDIPIYVSPDSSDVWANPELFQLDENRRQTAGAGCPPDGFSATGQLWGNPLYNWPYHKQTGFAWWIKRLKNCFDIYDVMRIDHFRGFDEYFSIPAGAPDATSGHWEKGPGMDLFRKVSEVFPGREIIAEDLGYVTDSVRKLVKDSGYPGMKVLEFAFDSRDSGSAEDYLPHNYEKNSVVYTGTHDNETVVGWFTEGLKPEEREAVRDYFCDHTTPDREMHMPMICAAMRSVSRLCIIPMQDLLGYGNEARMNTPSTFGMNWKWRLLKDEFGEKEVRTLREITARYGRLRAESK